MSLRQAERLGAERLLELEASFQRSVLADTFHEWEERKALAWGARVAGWEFKLFAQPKIRWFVATTLLSGLKRRRSH